MLREAITGMAEGCEALETPVVSGNVSLYNEHSGRPIHPTPVVGAVGVLEHAEDAVPFAPGGPGSRLFLLGSAVPAHDGSERQALEDGAVSGRIPDVDLAALGGLCGAARGRCGAKACWPRRTRSRTAGSPSRSPRSAWARRPAPRSTCPSSRAAPI